MEIARIDVDVVEESSASVAKVRTDLWRCQHKSVVVRYRQA